MFGNDTDAVAAEGLCGIEVGSGLGDGGIVHRVHCTLWR
jgi:hypothetical protein